MLINRKDKKIGCLSHDVGLNNENKKDRKIGYLWYDSSMSDADKQKKTKKLGIGLMVVVKRQKNWVIVS